MSTKTYLYIGTSIKSIHHICEMKITQVINEHATLYLKAIIEDEYKDDYIKTVNCGEQIEVAEGEKAQRVILFTGIAHKMSVKTISGVYYLEIQGFSNTYKTDIAIKSRSFQDGDMTYKELLDMVVKGGYPGGDIHDTVSLGCKIQRFTMQYRESDWEFLKRLASHFNMGVIPYLKDTEPKMTFGIPIGKNRGNIEKYNYYIEKNIGEYMKSYTNWNKELTELDKISFYIETCDNLDIGDIVMYKDIKLTIQSKEIEMLQGVLHFRYSLSNAKGLMRNLYYNEKIVGLSIMGKVLERIQDRVKVWLDIDSVQQPVDKSWEFPYTTMYTAEGNSGWYVMPEIDDVVYINFPNKEEFNGVGLNSIRTAKKASDKINDPDIKYFRTINGKELKFSQDEILITCTNWSNEETGEENIIYIRLNEKSGIEIQSTKPISITSDSDISMTSDKAISFSAKEEITLRCKTSQIKMDNMVDIAGEEVKIN